MDDQPVQRHHRGGDGDGTLASSQSAPGPHLQEAGLGQPLDQPYGAVSDLVQASINDLSASERKVADALLEAYPIAGLETVARLALRAGVSSPTVLRFSTRIGFASFSDLQIRLRREVQESLGSPARRYESINRDLLPASPAFTTAVRDLFVGTLTNAFEELSSAELDRVTRMVADRSRRITLIGGRFSKILATYLGAHLQMLRLGVQVVSEDELATLNSLASIRRNDLLIAFDFRRYDKQVIKFARAHQRGGGEVLLFTDNGLSPIAAVAAAVLPTPVESFSPFDSLVPAMAMAEALIAAVAVECGEQGRRRVNKFERHREDLR
jgi:DNA-binding MurR/RpiR family transcriptional regulator